MFFSQMCDFEFCNKVRALSQRLGPGFRQVYESGFRVCGLYDSYS